jgi:AhpD family alkylhydroperoxidase
VSRSPAATTTLPALAAQASALAQRLPDVAAVWGAGRLDPKLREEVMLAVAQANACRWCTLAHRQWALAEGVTNAELAALEDERPEAFDRAGWAAIAWAQARAHADLGPVALELERELARHYDAAQRADLDLVVRGMTLANLSANTFDALLARLRGRPVPGSRLVDEVVIGTGVALSIPPVAGYLALVRRRPPRRLLAELRALRAGDGAAA